MRRLLVFLSVLLSFSLHAARRRAVEPPAPACTFALEATFGVVPGDGLDRGVVHVNGSCVSWNAYAEADWVSVESAGMDALVSVAPNPTDLPRTTTLRIAGLRLVIAQDAAPAVADGNLLRNAHFDAGIEQWTWEDRFPNGAGIASWSSDDASASIASGSLQMRSTRIGQTFQRLQCVAVEPSRKYTYGGSVRASSATTGGGAFAFFEYPSADCSGAYTLFEQHSFFGAVQWQAKSWVTQNRTRPTTHSALLVIASSAVNDVPFDAWFDDLFVKAQ
jgi:hypothetical protein